MEKAIDKILKAIDFFRSIPDHKWCINLRDGPIGTACTLGHIVKHGNENIILLYCNVTVTILRKTGVNRYDIGNEVSGDWAIAAINNGETVEYQQDTPKERILQSLYDMLPKIENLDILFYKNSYNKEIIYELARN